MSEEDAILAGELALGVLDGEARTSALRRVLAEPAFAAQVTRWRRHFAGLIDSFPAAEPSADVERAVLAAIRADRQVAGRWRFAAATAAAIAASLAVVMAWPRHPIAPPAPAPAHVLVAALAGTDGVKPFNAVYDARTERVAVVGAAPWPADRSAELWLIAPGASPRPLGLLDRGERSSVAVPGSDRASMAAGVTLAVSIEPSGGSTTGLPTGPVIATGGLVSG
ncbi:anti-sigma factor [Sphingomonas bacterium]|uniref:anti-sigma factor n=1 Tax=Sphingomonas bacterium TaxID=1895847 RepID=UPI0015758B2B|nr:anti-sigma factor [Sphingomonas bacterium]